MIFAVNMNIVLQLPHYHVDKAKSGCARGQKADGAERL